MRKLSGIMDAAAERVARAYARRVGGRRYSVFDPAELFMVQERERRVLAILEAHGAAPLDGRRVLEVGCGSGYWLRQLVQWGARPADVVGVDLLPASLERARRACAGPTLLLRADAARLPIADASCDLAIQSTVLSSILERDVRARVAAELRRVVRPGGLILWYDARVDNPWNRDFAGVPAREVRQLFPGCEIALEPITLAPPLARWLARRSLAACRVLEAVPLLCTHLVGVIRPTPPRPSGPGGRGPAPPARS